MDNKDNLLCELHNSQQKIVALINTLSDDELNIPYHPGVNPPLWEVGHAAFFFEVFILKALDKAKSFNPAMDDIWDSFNIDHEDRWQPGTVPAKKETLDYIEEIYQRIIVRIENNELSQDDLYLYKYAIFHQNMHIESLIWARQTVAYGKMNDSKIECADTTQSSVPADEEMSAGDADIPGGRYVIGMPAGSDAFATNDFAFDTEKPRFEIDIDAFSISKTLVSNKEFLAFVEDGGYNNEQFWSWGGKKWLSIEQNIAIPPDKHMSLPKHPLCWKQQDGSWLERHFDQWLALVPDYPVMHICYWEAEAFCNWAGRRLPTEYEWEAAALNNRHGQAFKKYPWGDTMDASKVDMNGVHLAHVPVSAYPQGESDFGCRQMLGTAWEWTSSQYLPYDGFTMDMYPFMSILQFGYHKTTKGGSCATSSILIRGTYRQAYLPDRTDVFVGFRTCAL